MLDAYSYIPGPDKKVAKQKFIDYYQQQNKLPSNVEDTNTFNLEEKMLYQSIQYYVDSQDNFGSLSGWNIFFKDMIQEIDSIYEKNNT